MNGRIVRDPSLILTISVNGKSKAIITGNLSEGIKTEKVRIKTKETALKL